VQPPSEQQFNEVFSRVIASAPDGLSEEQFNALVDAELAKAEQPQGKKPLASMTKEEKVQHFMDDPFLKGAATGGVGTGGLVQATAEKGVGLVAGLMKRLGDRSMKGAMKIDRSYLNKMRGGRSVPIAEREQEIIDTANKLRINPVSPKGIHTTHEAVDAAQAQRQALIDAAPDVPVKGSGKAAVHEGRKVAQRLGRGEAPQARVGESLKTVQQVIDSPRTGEVTRQGVSFQQTPSQILGPNGKPVTKLTAVPGKEVRAAKDLRPKELAETITQTNEELRGLFGDTKLGPRAQTLMGTQGARREALDRVAGTAQNSDTMRRLIDLRNTQAIASHRMATHNPISLTDVISLSAGRPLVAAASFGMKPRALGAAGAALSQSVAPAIGRTAAPVGVTGEALARALLMMLSPDEQEP
jgi:hypothetical protein